MDEPGLQLGWLNDPRLAAHALSPSPVWLWRADAPRILWANPAGAAVFNAPSPAAVEKIDFDPQHPTARQIARLATALPAAGTPRLERLRGFGAALGGTSICLCSRIVLPGATTALLIIATERAGITLPLAERVRRLLVDVKQPSAVFSADGELIDALPAAKERLGHASDLVALDAAHLAREASQSGIAQGALTGGMAVLRKLGAGPSFALLLTFMATEQRTEPAPPNVPNPTAPANVPTLAAASTARRTSFRFVWQMDASLRFTLGAAEFARLLGPKTAAMLDQSWPELADALKLDPERRVAHALAARETWSGITVSWPVDGTDERLPVEMSGLPVFDRDRQFAGYRGFGICRDLQRLSELQRQRALALPAQPPAEDEAPDNVLPFPLPMPPDAAQAQHESVVPSKALPRAPENGSLSAGEHSAFQELARELNERLKHPASQPPQPIQEAVVARAPARASHIGNAPRDAQEGRPILERLPVGILVYRLNTLLYANHAFLDWTGYASLDELGEAGGLDSLFIETKCEAGARNGAKSLTIATTSGSRKPVEGRLFSVAWNGENALVLMIDTQERAGGKERAAAAEAALRRLEQDNSELKAILDTATDGVLVVDRAGRVLSANRSAEALFGYDAGEFAELSLADLLAPESRRPVLDALERIARAQGARMLDPGREAIGLVRQGGLVPLSVTMGRIEGGEKFCAVLRDLTAWKRNEEQLINARQEAEKASAAKSEFLAKISHEIRTPLNAIIGFSEVMMDERFGPMGNDRYRQYLKDIHASGEHLVALLNDLLDLSKIESGKLDLTFVAVDLNGIVQQCVAALQQEANHQRVIVRSALNPHLPPIVADDRSVRQVVLNILSNSINFSGTGGQVIVSTAVNEEHEVSLRVRDTGGGMSEQELQNALEPFRQLSTTARWGTSGTGLGLPITRALAEANHARFRISSEVDTGTLVEVAFPATRVLAT